MTDPAFVAALVDETVADRGQLDVFHSNAGAGLAQGPLLSIADDGWRADITLNLNAMFFCVREALRVMVPAGRGSIICTSSAAGVGAVPGTGPYGSAKAGILALVRSAAVEYGASGVRVNAVVPGSVQTPAFLEWIGTEERLAQYASQIPMGRMARPEDIADAVRVAGVRRGVVHHRHRTAGRRRCDGRAAAAARRLETQLSAWRTSKISRASSKSTLPFGARGNGADDHLAWHLVPGEPCPQEARATLPASRS